MKIAQHPNRVGEIVALDLDDDGGERQQEEAIFVPDLPTHEQQAYGIVSFTGVCGWESQRGGRSGILVDLIAEFRW